MREPTPVRVVSEKCEWFIEPDTNQDEVEVKQLDLDTRLGA